MSIITLDTLKLAQKLRDDVKFSPEQSERLAAVLSASISDGVRSDEVATKSDINALKVEIANAKVEIIKWVVGFGFAQAATIMAFMKLH